MKNGVVYMGQFRMKTGSRRNGRNNPSSGSVNTKTGSNKYENGWTKVENGTGQNGIFFVRFHLFLVTVYDYHCCCCNFGS
jgi:hypothetical protein